MDHMMKTPFLTASCGFAVLLSLNSSVIAADKPLEVVITAGRKAQVLKDTLAPVTVITRADIQRWQANDVADVLRRVPSLSIVNQGGAGQLTTLNIRGTNSNHVLVLVDGVKIGSATSGLTAFEFLPLEQIERIEVLRGPRSSLYGSEAIGGVIQIFTRRDAARGFTPSASVSVGTESTRKANMNLAGGNGSTWFNANVGYDKTDGLNASPAMNRPDADGYKNDSASVRFGHRFASGANVELSALQAKGWNNYDSAWSLEDQRQFDNQVLGLKASTPLGSRATVTAQLGRSKDDNDFISDGVVTYSANTVRKTASLQTDLKLGRQGQVSLGVEQQRDALPSGTLSVNDRITRSTFAVYEQPWGRNHLEVAARRDKTDDYGSSSTGSLALARDLTPNTRLKASYGTAFKLPTFLDLYGWGGSPALKPERSKNTEIGLSGSTRTDWQWSATAFDNRIRDLITFPAPTYNAQQVDKSHIRGVELEVAKDLGTWQVRTTATYQQPKSTSGSTEGKWLARRPQTQAKVDVDRNLGRGSVGASIQAFGKRYEDAANMQKLGGYSTVDLRAQYPVAKNLKMGIKIGNVLNKPYETAKGYNSLGRNGLMTLTYQPK
jgi:vitamin B12 transporter